MLRRVGVRSGLGDAVWLLLFVLAASGCAGDGEGSSSLYLPVLSGHDGSCSTAPSCPPLCVWALSTDAVVDGTIEDVRYIRTGAVVAMTGGGVVDSCDGAVLPTIELVLSVERSVFGDVAPGSTVHVRFGRELLELWDPSPLGRDGRISWFDRESGARVSPPFPRGQGLGLGLHRVGEENLWSNLGEPLFALEATGEVVFQGVRSDGCHEPPPSDFGGVTVDGMAELVAACGDEILDAARERKDAAEAVWLSQLQGYKSPICIPSDNGEPVGFCTSDRSCGPSERCVDNLCVKQPSGRCIYDGSCGPGQRCVDFECVEVK